MPKLHYAYILQKFILLFCLLGKLFITFFFRALAFFSSPTDQCSDQCSVGPVLRPVLRESAATSAPSDHCSDRVGRTCIHYSQDPPARGNL